MRLPFSLVQAALRSRAALVTANLALRQQLLVLNRQVGRPRLRKRDRIFQVLLRRSWTGWRRDLLMVKPDTVVSVASQAAMEFPLGLQLGR